jgi:hypothetical protein
MKTILALSVLVSAVVFCGCGRAEETQGYSKDLSQEMPKSQTTEPQFPKPKGFVIGANRGNSTAQKGSETGQ